MFPDILWDCKKKKRILKYCVGKYSQPPGSVDSRAVGSILTKSINSRLKSLVKSSLPRIFRDISYCHLQSLHPAHIWHHEEQRDGWTGTRGCAQGTQVWSPEASKPSTQSQTCSNPMSVKDKAVSATQHSSGEPGLLESGWIMRTLPGSLLSRERSDSSPLIPGRKEPNAECLFFEEWVVYSFCSTYYII